MHHPSRKLQKKRWKLIDLEVSMKACLTCTCIGIILYQTYIYVFSQQLIIYFCWFLFYRGKEKFSSCTSHNYRWTDRFNRKQTIFWIYSVMKTQPVPCTPTRGILDFKSIILLIMRSPKFTLSASMIRVN